MKDRREAEKAELRKRLAELGEQTSPLTDAEQKRM
jgi:hypothetical protein